MIHIILNYAKPHPIARNLFIHRLNETYTPHMNTNFSIDNVNFNATTLFQIVQFLFKYL